MDVPENATFWISVCLSQFVCIFQSLSVCLCSLILVCFFRFATLYPATVCVRPSGEFLGFSPARNVTPEQWTSWDFPCNDFTTCGFWLIVSCFKFAEHHCFSLLPSTVRSSIKDIVLIWWICCVEKGLKTGTLVFLALSSKHVSQFNRFTWGKVPPQKNGFI